MVVVKDSLEQREVVEIKRKEINSIWTRYKRKGGWNFGYKFEGLKFQPNGSKHSFIWQTLKKNGITNGYIEFTQEVYNGEVMVWDLGTLEEQQSSRLELD